MCYWFTTKISWKCNILVLLACLGPQMLMHGTPILSWLTPTLAVTETGYVYALLSSLVGQIVSSHKTKICLSVLLCNVAFWSIINTMPMVLAVLPSIWIMGRTRRTADYSSCSDLRKTTGTLEGKTTFDSADTFPKSDQSHGFTGPMT